MGLRAREETPARTPWWLLALRMLAATLVIVAAGPARCWTPARP
ncbi:MAG: BatA domain-containing protein [Acetobacteraceae bacterium]